MKKFLVSLAIFLTVSYSVAAQDPLPSQYMISKKQSTLEFPSECVAQAIKNEAGGEDWKGQVAVAWVIRNRLYSGKFPNTACKIVYQKQGSDCQFTFICSPFTRVDMEKNADFYSIAMMVLYSSYQFDPTLGALYFSNKPRKDKNLIFLVKIGHHYFYTDIDAYIMHHGHGDR